MLTWIRKNLGDIVIILILAAALFLSIRANVRINRVEKKVNSFMSEMVKTNKEISSQLEVIDSHFQYIDKKMSDWFGAVSPYSIEINNNNAKTKK